MEYGDLGVVIPVVLILDLAPDENDVDRQARRTDAPVMRSEDWTFINDKVDALLAGPFGPRLRFVDPKTAVARLTGEAATGVRVAAP